MLTFIILISTVNALNFTVASYNVENLFDLKNDGTEYEKYRPNSKYWNKKNLEIKLTNIAQVVNDINADIIALQEVESQKALSLLSQKLPQYEYKYFLKNRKSAVGIGFLSKYKIIKTSKIDVDRFDKYARPILEIIFEIDDKKFKIYNNHWRSKKAGENYRVKYAVALKNHIFELKDDDYVVLGDFNSNYNEWQTFRNEKRLNNTYGITGINHILNTVIDDKLILQNSMYIHSKKIHYNLWLELSKKQRFSAMFRNQKNTPDNILLPLALFDNKNISYIDDSFKVFKPKYLYENKKINRWKRDKGYSDHLPIMATFTTEKIIKKKIISKSQVENNTIQYLYECEHLTKPLNLKNVVVIYKYQKGAILKQKNGRAIYAYNCATNLKLGEIYNLTINKIQLYNGLLEVTSIENILKIKENKNYKNLYKDATKIDIFDTKYTNEIITNLRGIYKKRYLHFNNHKIRLFTPKYFNFLKEGDNITIKSGHLTIYKGQVQIAIHKKSDIMHND